MKKQYAISLDIGGTSLKTAIVSSEGNVPNRTFYKTPIDSQGSSESIIGTFVKLLDHNLDIAREFDLYIAGISICTCGPFDMRNGISLMRHKYASIYGLNLKEEFRNRLRLDKDFPVIIVSDSYSFLRGESWIGAARGCSRAVGITLGTGLGSSFMIDGKIVSKGAGLPPNAELWCLPFGNGILEDVVSKRGIIKKYKELGGKHVERIDVRDIALRGLEKKDENSLRVFYELGNTLGDVLKPILLEFEPTCLVFGGQISNSFNLFSKPIKAKLKDIKSLTIISQAHYIDLSPIYGAAKFLFEKLASR